MKLRMRKMPRPLDLSRFSGASGLATVSGSKPSPWSRTRMVEFGTRVAVHGVSNSTNTCLAASLRLPCLMALMTRFADRDADPVHRVLVEADVSADVVADHLDEIEHLERAGELEADEC